MGAGMSTGDAWIPDPDKRRSDVEKKNVVADNELSKTE